MVVLLLRISSGMLVGISSSCIRARIRFGVGSTVPIGVCGCDCACAWSPSDIVCTAGCDCTCGSSPRATCCSAGGSAGCGWGCFLFIPLAILCVADRLWPSSGSGRISSYVCGRATRRCDLRSNDADMHFLVSESRSLVNVPSSMSPYGSRLKSILNTVSTVFWPLVLAVALSCAISLNRCFCSGVLALQCLSAVLAIPPPSAPPTCAHRVQLEAQSCCARCMNCVDSAAYLGQLVEKMTSS
ncbi:hypothetical protein DL89DRAFT_172051 [Linderina pennispora]|uniref:4Fe-4S ferredoxin-type domain-containing protein n=1 Tax=Linderina pennispora TaxID=61395 RepID=A0A1Y1W6U1_9FUNG|nr:uncharacterized protein DL89DRAFT_172051 [Linderina pennispora]ORX69142.1 hypothetical protein DL89DRAFT_172051 [Linderina pennispora]